jgi:hypothetical protein
MGRRHPPGAINTRTKHARHGVRRLDAGRGNQNQLQRRWANACSKAHAWDPRRQLAFYDPGLGSAACCRVRARDYVICSSRSTSRSILVEASKHGRRVEATDGCVVTSLALMLALGGLVNADECAGQRTAWGFPITESGALKKKRKVRQ